MLTQEEIKQMKMMTYADLEEIGFLLEYDLHHCKDPNLRLELREVCLAIDFEMDRRGEEWEKRWRKEMERKGKK